MFLQVKASSASVVGANETPVCAKSVPSIPGKFAQASDGNGGHPRIAVRQGDPCVEVKCKKMLCRNAVRTPRRARVEMGLQPTKTPAITSDRKDARQDLVLLVLGAPPSKTLPADASASS
jgi:hypothetical protein